MAAAMHALLAGSEIREGHREGDARVQHPCCIRRQPQVTGAAMDVLRMAARTLEVEANAATDNPLVLVAAGRIVSGGNFHADCRVIEVRGGHSLCATGHHHPAPMPST